VEAQRKTPVVTGPGAVHFDELFEWKVGAADLADKALVVSLCEEGMLTNGILAEVWRLDATGSGAADSHVRGGGGGEYPRQTSLDLKPLVDGRVEWNDAFPLHKRTSTRLDVTKKRKPGKA
jgi:hypothetical protein